MARSKPIRLAASVMAAAFAVAGCSSGSNSVFGSETRPGDTPNYATASTPSGVANNVEAGVAAWDGDVSAPGLVAAHPTMPIGSWARVTNTRTGQATIVRITRRLPRGRGHSIELSRDAAAGVGALHEGLADVIIQPIDPIAATPYERAQQPVNYTEIRVQTPAVETAPMSAPTPAAANPTSAATTYVRSNFSAPTQSHAQAQAHAHAQSQAYDPSLATGSIPRNPAASVSSQAATGPTFVQVGSFRDPANARRLLHRVQQQGLATNEYGRAFIQTARVGGRVYHRVRLGPIASQDSARRALRDAIAYGHNDARILRR